MKCECTRICTTRVGGYTVFCNVGDVHEFDVCPPHFAEVKSLSGMGAPIPQSFGVQLSKAKVTSKRQTNAI